MLTLVTRVSGGLAGAGPRAGCVVAVISSVRFRGLEKQVQNETYSVHLLIRTLARVVLVLVVGIELDMLAHRQQATRIEIGGADF